MPKAQMTGRERILATVDHQEPDRVPISPRINFAWLDPDGSHRLYELYGPLWDHMDALSSGTRHYVAEYPDEYDLPEVQVRQVRYREEPFQVIEREFVTPAGTLTDRIKVPPAGIEYGMGPNPLEVEHLVKTPDDLPALEYLLPAVNTNFDHVHRAQEELGDRGVVMVNIYSELCRRAGLARGMQDLMTDYYADRPFFDRIVGMFQERTLAETHAALEAGVEWIFLNSYYNSISSGWSPAIFREVFVPHIREIVDLVHEYGAYLDYYDDGKLTQTMEMIAECEVDVLETCCPAPVGDFDLRKAKATIGARTTLKGYVDLLWVVKHGTPELVERTVAEAMEIAKPGGGFIIGSSDCFREGTPPENIHAYFQACVKYGAYD